MSFSRAVRFALPVALLASALSNATLADDQPSKAEKALKYRKSVYQVIAWNFGPLAAMAQDKIPFDAAQFALRAGRVAELTPMLTEAYPPETQARDVAEPRGLRCQAQDPDRAQRVDGADREAG
jgi:cytochrome c556